MHGGRAQGKQMAQQGWLESFCACQLPHAMGGKPSGPTQAWGRNAWDISPLISVCVVLQALPMVSYLLINTHFYLLSSPSWLPLRALPG